MALLLMFIGAGLMLLSSVWHNRKLNQVLVPKPLQKHLPRAISLLVVVSQLPELVRMLEKVTIVHAVAALMLLALVAANSSSETHLGA